MKYAKVIIKLNRLIKVEPRTYTINFNLYVQLKVAAFSHNIKPKLFRNNPETTLKKGKIYNLKNHQIVESMGGKS